MTTIKERYELVQQRIAQAAERVHRDPNRIHLVAVTKHASIEEVRRLVDLGHVDFGESRLQHFTQMAAQIEEYIGRRKELGEPDLPQSIRWHFLGHLQRNKCRRILPLTRMVHSLDSLRLAEEIQEIAQKRDLIVEVLLQTNISKDRQKTGIAPAAVDYLLEQLATMPNIKPRGMMCMAPFCEDPEDSRPYFERCQEIFVEMQKSPWSRDAFNILSMGMSNDFEIAIECGANIVRIGTAIFGQNAGTQETGSTASATK